LFDKYAGQDLDRTDTKLVWLAEATSIKRFELKLLD
jgi:hypothetical protein